MENFRKAINFQNMIHKQFENETKNVFIIDPNLPFDENECKETKNILLQQFKYMFNVSDKEGMNQGNQTNKISFKFCESMEQTFRKCIEKNCYDRLFQQTLKLKYDITRS